MNMKWMFSDPHPFVAKTLFQVSCCKRMRFLYFLCLIPKYSKRLYSMQPLQSKTCPTGLLEFWQVCHEVLPPRWVDSGCINDIGHKSSVWKWWKHTPKSSAGFPAHWHPFGPTRVFQRCTICPESSEDRLVNHWQCLTQYHWAVDGCSMLYPQSSSWTAACSRGFWDSLSPSWRWKNDRDIRWVQLMTNSPFKMQISTALNILNRKCWILTGCTLWQTNLATEKRRVQQRHQLPFPGMSQAVQYII